MGNECVVKKRILPYKLCAGDLRHKMEIQTRDLTATSDFEDSQPIETFSHIRYQYCAIESIAGVTDAEGVMRFKGIHISRGSTHLIWTNWDADFPDLEHGNNYFLWDNKRYKVLTVNDVNERKRALAIQVTERGEDSEEATKA